MHSKLSKPKTGQKKEVQALSELPDDRIDTTDVPEILDWSGARRGVFYRPVKQHPPRPRRLMDSRFRGNDGAGRPRE